MNAKGPSDPRDAVNGMLARGVRAALVTYAKTLRDALDAGCPARTLVENGVPLHDIEAALGKGSSEAQS